MYYKLLHNLSHQGEIIRRGSVVSLDLPEADITLLEERGAIVEMWSPHLEDLGNPWPAYATVLDGAGILTMENFVNADTNDLAELLGLSTDDVEELKASISDGYRHPEECCGD